MRPGAVGQQHDPHFEARFGQQCDETAAAERFVVGVRRHDERVAEQGAFIGTEIERGLEPGRRPCRRGVQCHSRAAGSCPS